tara:strand:+ start:292 stop:606 length:315 start_codon:yes stop_codon:yes gene_type:complete
MKSKFSRDSIKQFLQEQSLPIEEVVDKRSIGKYAYMKYEEIEKLLNEIKAAFSKVGGIENQRFLDYSYSHLSRGLNNKNAFQGSIPITLEDSILDLIGEEVDED